MNSNYLANYSTMQNKFREWQPQSTMLKFSFHKFVDGEFCIMEDYNTSLTSLYGDYMTLPPIEKQVAHFDNSYFWK
jgi:lipopolysaccharide cholinephosphotransferase